MSLFRRQRVSMLILAVLLLPLFEHSLSLDRFVRVPHKTYYVKEGEDLDLPCVPKSENFTCIWQRNSSSIFPDSNTVYEMRPVKGDCSVILKKVSVDRDNTTFECQVPSFNQGGSKYSSSWPRTSVIVMVKPNAPRFKEEPFQSILAGQTTSLVCESLGGNPLPSLEWHLGNKNITASANTTVVEKSKSVISTLNYVFAKENNRASLTCVSVHRLEKQTTKKLLNVTYRPIVSVDRRVFNVLENHNLSIECHVDANPMAPAMWKSDTTKNYKTVDNSLILTEVKGKAMDDKEFQCTAKNVVGGSETVTIVISVSYRPHIAVKTPKVQSVLVGGDVEMICETSGNPKPTITWTFVDYVYNQQHNPSPADPSKLVIHNVSYLDEGDYYCEGENKIGNDINKATSEKMIVSVSGKPQFLSPNEPVIGFKNENTAVEAVFCSDPPPTRVTWMYDSISQHEIDTNFQKKVYETNFYEVEDGIHIKAGPLVPIDQPKSPNHTCFRSMLYIVNTDIADAKDFTVTVENKNGLVDKVIHLQVHNKISGAMIISISLILLLMMFILTILFIFFLRRRSSDQQGDDHGEDKSDSNVPIHNSDDAEKQATIEKVL